MRKPSPFIFGSTLAALALAPLLAGAAAPAPTPAPASPDAARSAAAFVEIAAVLRHPRCINCHTLTDFPRQGDDGKPHAMLVRRGPDNHGRPGLACATCHQDANQAESGVPGAPNWSIAPLAMGWEGLDDHQLAEALKDRAKNGNRSLEEIYHHMAEDALVGWGWNPGGNRRPVPVSREELARQVRTWIDTGAVSPPPGKPSGKEAP